MSAIKGLNPADLQANLTAIDQGMKKPPSAEKVAPSPKPSSPPVPAARITTAEKLLLLSQGKWQGILKPDGTLLYPSQSEADQGFCSIIARSVNGDLAKIDALFRKTALFRSKWDEKRGAQTYGELTITEALRGFKPDSKGAIDPASWPQLFHTADEIRNIPPPKWLIEGFSEVQDKTVIGGPSGHAKTFILMSIARALLRARDESRVKLWNFFPVPSGEHKVVYLIPEETLGKFKRRMEWFELMKYVDQGRLFIRTITKGPKIRLQDPRILKAVEGAHVFLDTVVRFIEGDESSSSDNSSDAGLATSIDLMLGVGAASVWGAAHSPKGHVKEDYMSLENVIRGTGDLGAMLSNAYGVRQLDDDRQRTWIQVENIKPRNFEDEAPRFQLEGKPWIVQEHDFRMVSKPGETGLLAQYLHKKQGRPEKVGPISKLECVLAAVRKKKSYRDIATELMIHHKTVGNWVQDYQAAADKANMPLEEFLLAELKNEKEVLY